MPKRPVAQQWRLSGDLGRRYAAVSGDVNPIHLHPLTARVMGFPKAIAHGMWTYPRTLAALGARHAYAGSSHVWFRKPVLLPTTVALVAQPAADGSVVAALVAPKEPKRVHLVLRTS
ncbi:MAG: MaoC/PaaZ C-terminal domain-containing protein [Tetrasphaera sp.]